MMIQEKKYILLQLRAQVTANSVEVKHFLQNILCKLTASVYNQTHQSFQTLIPLQRSTFTHTSVTLLFMEPMQNLMEHLPYIHICIKPLVYLSYTLIPMAKTVTKLCILRLHSCQKTTEHSKTRWLHNKKGHRNHSVYNSVCTQLLFLSSIFFDSASQEGNNIEQSTVK